MPDRAGRAVAAKYKRGSWVDRQSGKPVRGLLFIFGRDPDPYDGPNNGHDPYFGLPLWLRTDCCGGHVLWAYNDEHLDFLAAFIGARLRVRPTNHPTTFTWRLPKWMKDAKHRDELLRGIARLRSAG